MVNWLRSLLDILLLLFHRIALSDLFDLDLHLPWNILDEEILLVPDVVLEFADPLP
jgi:hypothetical protein